MISEDKRFHQIVAEARQKALQSGIPENDRAEVNLYAVAVLAHKVEKLEVQLMESRRAAS